MQEHHERDEAGTPTDLDSLRALIEERLTERLVGMHAWFREIEPRSVDLLDLVSGLVSSGGRRIRPLLTVISFMACGGRIGQEILDVAVSIEMLHTFALIHDDVMDSSDVRRGVRTIGAASGDAVAILAGDLALILSDHIYWDSGFQPSALSKAAKSIDQMRLEAIAGQYLDLKDPHAQAAKVADLKTTSYTIRGPLRIGAHLAGGSVPRSLDLFSEPLGAGFQLANDLVGLFSGPSPAQTDIAGPAKNRLFEIFYETCSDEESIANVTRVRTSAATDQASIDLVRSAITESGALKVALESVRSSVFRAKKILEEHVTQFPRPTAAMMLNEIADLVLIKAVAIAASEVESPGHERRSQ
ncbi:MAG: polyprenyl synthetase family protein [Actinobacteria bacterium]|nr:polyprenyl synthetase family protein [Actinomycetota bacterium]